MGNLLDIYVAQNEAEEKVAEEKVAEEKVAEEKVELTSEETEVVEAYVKTAEAELKNSGEEYSEEDIAKVAEYMMEQDITAQQDAEETIKMAEDIGKIVAISFVKESAVLLNSEEK